MRWIKYKYFFIKRAAIRDMLFLWYGLHYPFRAYSKHFLLVKLFKYGKIPDSYDRALMEFWFHTDKMWYEVVVYNNLSMRILKSPNNHIYGELKINRLIEKLFAFSLMFLFLVIFGLILTMFIAKQNIYSFLSTLCGRNGAPNAVDNFS